MFWFNEYTTTPTVVNAIEAVTYQNGGNTYTHRALKQIYARMVDPAVSGMSRIFTPETILELLNACHLTANFENPQRLVDFQTW